MTPTTVADIPSDLLDREMVPKEPARARLVGLLEDSLDGGPPP